MVDVRDMVGKTFVKVDVNEDNEEIRFIEPDGSYYRFFHMPDCCESVYIKDIVGDLNNLVGEPLLVAEVSTNQGDCDNNYNSYTWTFYKFATIKGWVDISWYGESNGFYSEDVDLMYVNRGKITTEIVLEWT